MTKMNLRIEHQVPGRVRMKIPAGKGNPDLLKQISEVFGVIPGIEEISVNPTTGSVVLHYDADRHDEFHGNFRQHYDAHGAAHGVANGGMHGADTELDKLTGSIEAEAEFLASHSHSARAVVDFVKKLDREVKLATNNTRRLEDHLCRRNHRLDGIRGRSDGGDAGMGYARHFHGQPFHRDARATAARQQNERLSKPGAGPGHSLRVRKVRGRRKWNSRSVTLFPVVSGCICRRCAENKSLPKPPSFGSKRSTALSGRG